MNNTITITFKSNADNYVKEEYGLKPNTFRKVDESDKRFQELKQFGKLLITDFRIRIVCDEFEQAFERDIKDVTFWDGYCIISWRA